MFQILSWEHDTVEATDRSLRILHLHFGTLLGCPRVVSRSECTYLAFTFRGSDWFSSCRIAKIKYVNCKHGYLFSGYDFMPASADIHKRNTDLDNTSMSPTAKLSKFESWLCGLSFSIYKMGCKMSPYRVFMMIKWVNICKVIRTMAGIYPQILEDYIYLEAWVGEV